MWCAEMLNPSHGAVRRRGWWAGILPTTFTLRVKESVKHCTGPDVDWVPERCGVLDQGGVFYPNYIAMLVSPG